jgi:hypothetical protein
MPPHRRAVAAAAEPALPWHASGSWFGLSLVPIPHDYSVCDVSAVDQDESKRADRREDHADHGERHQHVSELVSHRSTVSRFDRPIAPRSCASDPRSDLDHANQDQDDHDYHDDPDDPDATIS